MNYIKRLLLGVLSSLLLAVGFARAADHLDPLATALAKPGIAPLSAAEDTEGGGGTACWANIE